jgi:hypothetical protein
MLSAIDDYRWFAEAPDDTARCVDCGRDLGRLRWTALDGLARCRPCHVLAARARRRATMR